MPKRPKRKIHSHNSSKLSSPAPTKKFRSSSASNPKSQCANMSSSANVHVLKSPVKSLNDKKEYKVIRLENGLTACLISDVSEIHSRKTLSISESESESDNSQYETDSGSENVSDHSCDPNIVEEDSDDTMNKYHRVSDKEETLAAASLTIGVGSFSDPEAIPGMAHFLEHMVFMGSEKYPQENDFDAFLKKRGGYDNALTDCETTTFYFECFVKHLFKALDKFAQFFISPLMKREAMTRERQAIESEFQMALPSDAYRKEQLLASFAKAGSPVNKFLWGNLITLRDNVQDDDLYERVHEFRKRHYSAHRMTLAIQACLPLDVLETYVKECFNDVPNNSLLADNFKAFTDEVFDTPEFKRIYYVKPVKDVCQVDLTFVIPSLLEMYKSKPHQYISWLIGHEGKGSLYSYLRNKMWALNIETGNSEDGMEHNSMYALFTVMLVLTQDGLVHLYEVIEAVFSYLNMLKKVGPQERIFNEIKAVGDTLFRFQNEETAVDIVESLSEAMQYYPPEDYITGYDLYFEYNPTAITMVLNKLNPDNMNIMILSSSLHEKIQYNKTETWFSTPYTDKEIPSEWLKGWENVEPYQNFGLPEPNRFLTSNFSLLDIKNASPLYPEKIIDNDLVELWYMADRKYKQPIAFMNYYFISSLAQESAINACMVDLFVGILYLQIAEEVYPAHVAELGISVSVGDCGIIVEVDGYNEKLPLLLELIVNYMKKLPSATTEDLFNAVKDKQSKSYYNTFIKPSKLARHLRLSMLMNVYWSSLTKHKAIFDITLDQFINFTEKFLHQFHIQGLVQGNMYEEVAINTTNNLINILKCTPVPGNQIPQVQVTQVPLGKQVCKVMSFNHDDVNAIITNYYQYGPGTLKTLVIIEILMLLIEEPLFDVLRTKEQLGYQVFCTVCDTFGILGFSVTVVAQSTKHTTDFVNQRIEAFLKRIVKLIKKMPDKKIAKIKHDLIKVKQLADVHLKEEVSRNWTEILHQNFMFDRIPKEIAAIELVKVSEIRKFLDVYTMSNKYTKKLSIQVVGHKTPDEYINKTSITKEESSVENKITNKHNDYTIKYAKLDEDNTLANEQKHITDIFEFKKGLSFFPVHKIAE